jgi:hypothetical protein
VKMIWLALVCLGWIAACAHAPPPLPAPGPLPEQYMPLAVGNTWVYVDRSPQLTTTTSGRERTVRILRRDPEGYYHDNQRGQLRADGDCLHDRLRRLLCRPFEKGKGWVSVVSSTSTERYEIVSVDEKVQTPAGLFDRCIKVRATNRAGPATEHVLEVTYALGVGIVRIETFVVVKGVVAPQVRAELKSFKLER